MVGGVTPYAWNFGSSWPRWSKIADFQSIFARGTSLVARSKNGSVNTNTCFPMSLRWTSYIASSPQGGSKTQNGRFPSKMALCLKKVCYKVSLRENSRRQSYKAYLSVQKWLVGQSPFPQKFGRYWPSPLQNVSFQSVFTHSTLAERPSKNSSINTNRKSTTHFSVH